jgi:hypothetical protein
MITIAIEVEIQSMLGRYRPLRMNQ